MPELPEVETVKRGLAKVLVGKKVAAFESDWHKAVNKPVPQYNKLLKGLKILGVRRRARMIILDLSQDWKIFVHLKMTGQLVFRDQKQCLIGGHPIETSCANLPNKFTHAIFSFSDGSFLYFNDVRKFGWVRLFTAEELEQVVCKMQLGPEPLSQAFSLKYWLGAMAKRPRTKIKQFIMDNKVVVGVGNIYSDEVCFYARVMPNRAVGTIAPAQAKKLYQGILKILKAAIKAQGTTFSNYVNSDGEAGAYTKKLKVYQRYGKKCYACKGIVKRMKIGGRTSSYCPKCQH